MAAAQEVGEQEETRDKIYHGQKRFLVADQYVFIDLLYFFHHQKKTNNNSFCPGVLKSSRTGKGETTPSGM